MQPIENIRHSLAHLLGAAILEIYPNAKLTLGPSIDDGFYYDFDASTQIGTDDLKTIESKMREILPSFKEVSRNVLSAEEAKEYFKNNSYKLELIDEIISRGDKITTYTMGSFTDLCQGGHAENLCNIDPQSFKLTRIAGAYWRGNEKNKMLTRIYGIAFYTKEELEKYEWQQEEAKKRDHRKLGRELNLFTLSDLVGAGLPMFQPNGVIIRKELEEYLWVLHKNRGYQRVWTPHLAKESLYETSGHAGHYMDDMFLAKGGSSKEDFYVKPMNCPHHMQIFADNQFSYRDMPVRYFEPTTVYRDEKTGQLSGLTRVRSITQDDGHLFCRTSQLGEEIKTIVQIIKEFYTTMGMMDGYWVRLSLRGEDKTQYLGSDEVWSLAEKALTDICIEENLPYTPAPDEAAFYGPKLDFMFKDAIGREWQLATIQCDFNQPERFDLSFTNEKGEKERPVVIHRAISGSLERFMGVMIEHFAGSFPVWLSPVQTHIIPISESQAEFAKEISLKLQALDIRNKVLLEDSLGKRIRLSKTKKTPYQIVIGNKEVESGILTIEARGDKKLSMTIDEFISHITDEIKSRKDK